MSQMLYSVYMHTFPSGKKYVGVTKDISQRWRPGAYASNKKMYAEIEQVGWDKIKHEVLFSGLSREDAQKKEIELIKEYDTIKHGYNKSRGGGGINNTFFSKAVMEHLDILRRMYVAIKNPAFNDAYQRLSSMADNEYVALHINLLELYARENKELIRMKPDKEMYIALWVNTIEAGLLRGEDVRTYSIREAVRKSMEV